MNNPLKKVSRMRLTKAQRRYYMQRSITMVPNLFTLGNAFFGFCSLIAAAHGETSIAAYCILLGALFDGLDGKLARLLNASSPFGVQLDSLCDLVSFIIAPAFLAYTSVLCHFGIFGFIAASLFVLAGVSRLARFNITTAEQTYFFLGVPSTIAGCFIATSFLFHEPWLERALHSVTSSLVMCLLAYLMISPLRFPKFKTVSKKSYIRACFLFIACVVTLGLTKVLYGIFCLYFVYGCLLGIQQIIRAKLLS